MVTLYDVIDTRTNQYHSVAIVKEKNVKYFIKEGDANENTNPAP